MSSRRQSVRRLCLVLLSVAVAAIVLRPQVSSALVSRGDDLQYSGDVSRALAMYRRALSVDRDNTIAADRFAFLSMTTHAPENEETGLRLVTEVLARHPGLIALRYDRALCAHALRRYDQAARDFEAVGLRARDPRALTFAALDFRREHIRRARELLRLAIRFDPHFEPARRDLARL